MGLETISWISLVVSKEKKNFSLLLPLNTTNRICKHRRYYPGLVAKRPWFILDPAVVQLCDLGQSIQSLCLTFSLIKRKIKPRRKQYCKNEWVYSELEFSEICCILMPYFHISVQIYIVSFSRLVWDIQSERYDTLRSFYICFIFLAATERKFLCRMPNEAKQMETSEFGAGKRLLQG